jgi:predicted CoA-substrate-specific enzyme activase
MNDKCAAGTGRFLQVMATALGLDVSELGDAEDPGQMQTISSMCTVFAESEIIGSLARGNPKGGIIAGLHQSVGKRVAAMARRMGIKEQVAFTGGVAINPGVKRALEKSSEPRLWCPKLVSTRVLWAQPYWPWKVVR